MLVFLLSAIAISLSGVMAPGPITAATLAAGVRSRHAGMFIALGHAVIEMPLILLLVAGIDAFFKFPEVKAGIGLVGGVVLILMGIQLLWSLRRCTVDSEIHMQLHPFITGVVLTVANPYFLIWWATVGLALASQAAEYGGLTLLAFAVVHWLCDLGWLEVLSCVGFKGSQVFGLRSQMIISMICALVLLAFGLMFCYDAGIMYSEKNTSAAGPARWAQIAATFEKHQFFCRLCRYHRPIRESSQTLLSPERQVALGRPPTGFLSIAPHTVALLARRCVGCPGVGEWEPWLRLAQQTQAWGKSRPSSKGWSHGLGRVGWRGLVSTSWLWHLFLLAHDWRSIANLSQSRVRGQQEE